MKKDGKIEIDWIGIAIWFALSIPFWIGRSVAESLGLSEGVSFVVGLVAVVAVAAIIVPTRRSPS